ncbi:MAG: AraC family transcriptional regulator [Deltaproteobacteria bacterium]|jgi:AraC-like DNA-binding protein|nr:AraC family transcriptional regulator [Deltaproteobacteria bacterium]
MPDLKRSLDRLAETIKLTVSGPGSYATPVPGVKVHCRNKTNQPENCFFKPLATLIVQGEKRTIWGADEFTYGAGWLVINAVQLPSASSITQGSDAKPFLGISLELDHQLLTRLTAEILTPPPPVPGRAVAVFPADLDLVNAYLRLAQLADKPNEITVLAPLITSEIHYRSLIGPAGGVLRALNHAGGQSHQVAKAIAWLRDNFKQPLYVEELARRVNMAPSTFHRHFRDLTTLSPLNYQKRLRLYEAQRLMMVEQLDAASASLAVGYESPSQFNREYKRLFGDSPRRDVTHRMKK